MINLGLKALPWVELPIKCGCDYLRDENGSILKRNFDSAKYIANKMAGQQSPRGKWQGCVVDCCTYYRISIGFKEDNI